LAHGDPSLSSLIHRMASSLNAPVTPEAEERLLTAAPRESHFMALSEASSVHLSQGQANLTASETPFQLSIVFQRCDEDRTIIIPPLGISQTFTPGGGISVNIPL